VPNPAVSNGDLPMKKALVQAIRLWQKHRGSRVAAALAFYAIFTVPWLLLVVVTVARAVLGHAHALHAIDAELAPLLGPKGAAGVNTLVAASQHRIATTPLLFGAVLVIVAVFAIFMQVQEALDDLWDIPEHTRGGAWEIVVLRLHAVLGIVALALLAVLALFAAAAGGRIAAIAVNAAAIVAFLTVAYRVLPRAPVGWKNCALGALLTGAILLLGEAAIALYFSRFHPEQGYGNAGSLILVLIWIYYSALLFLFGAVLARTLEKNDPESASSPKPPAR
jgi:membrane protein